MTHELNELKHDIVVGRCEDGKILLPKNAGSAIKRGDDGFYSMRLHMFPGVTYFLSKNHGDNPNYTLFSRILRTEGGVRFQNPVGAARLRPDLKTHLEIRFNLIDRRIFMSLFPA
jgi:hypothetical protein